MGPGKSDSLLFGGKELDLLPRMRAFSGACLTCGQVEGACGLRPSHTLRLAGGTVGVYRPGAKYGTRPAGDHEETVTEVNGPTGDEK